MKGSFRKTAKPNARRSNNSGRSGGTGLGSRLLAVSLPICAALGWVVMVGCITVGLLYSYRWVTRTPLFGLEEIFVKGNHYLEDEEVVSRAGLEPGQNVLGLNIARIQARLTKEPWVEAVRIKRELPDTLILTIREREASFWIRSGTSLFYADSRGERISPVTPGKFISLPFLVLEEENERNQKILAELVRQLQGRLLPFSDREVAWVRMGSGDLVTLFLEEGMKIVLDGEHLPLSGARLKRVWADLRAKNELSRVRTVSVLGSKAWVELISD